MGLTDIFSKRKKQPNNMHDHWGLPGLDQRPDSPAEPDADAPACDSDSGGSSSSSMSSTGAYEKEHEWLPEGKYWGQNHESNDQRLFDGDHLRPEVHDYFINKIASFMMTHHFAAWSRWTKVYFAGSEAAEWAPFNGDLDCLVGIDNDLFRETNPEFSNLSDAEIAHVITSQMTGSLNNAALYITLKSGDRVGPFDSTFYVNPNSYDIRSIKPYAAYDVTDDTWIVKPLKVPTDWSAQSLPESFWDVSEAEANLINVISELPPLERQRVATQVYDMIHEGRKSAFTKGGKSMFDFNNVVEKYLDQRPDHPLAKLIAMKKADVDESTDAWQPPQPDLGDFLSKRAIAEQDKGIMIAFVPPLEVRQQLVQEKGEPVDDMHVTVCYLGKLGDLTPKQRRFLPDLVQNWAVAQHNLHANLSGVGTFANPDSHALVALPDIPHAGKMRESLVEYLEAHGYPIRHNHGWTPHLTIAYSKYHWRFIPKTHHLAWEIGGVSVFMAGRETVVPFGPRDKG